VSFESAARVFEDPHEIILNDEEHSEDEQRFLSIGRSGRRILVVSYTEREEGPRIISAREANASESASYFEQF
jgi:uncharacterized DUF497 family protein